MSELGKEIERRRHVKGWSQEFLANELGVSTRTISRWEKGDPISKFYIVPIKRVLNFSDYEIMKYIGSKTPDLYDEICFNELFDKDGTLKTFISKLDYVEKENPSFGDDINEYGDDEKWRGIFEMSSDTGCAIFSKEKEVAGYWFFAGISEQKYELGIRGENINKTLIPMDIEPFSLPGKYDVYFVDLFIKRKFDNSSVKIHIYNSILDIIEEMAINGIFIKRIFGNMSSEKMIKLARNIGFLEKCDHKVHKMQNNQGIIVPTKVYEINLESNEKPRLFERREKLSYLYGYK